MSDDRADRPTTFLVSIAATRGASEVFDALAPLLDRIGSRRHVAHPESSLPFVAARIRDQGGVPIHLAIGAAHECYLTPALPNLLLPLWDYPEVPAIDLNRNSRMNWARVASRADLIVAPSESTVGAFRRSGVTTPAVVLPPPIRGGWADLATWGPDLPVSVHVPHVAWGGGPGQAAERAAKAARRLAPVATVGDDARVSIAPEPGPTPSLRDRARRTTKRRLRRLKPYFSNATIEKLDGYKNRVLPLIRRPNPIRIAGGVARLGYRHLVRRWIGEGAHAKLRGLAGRLGGRRPAPVHHDQTPSTLGAGHLTISGLAYSAWIDYDDPTTDDQVLLSAFLHAFADRPDVTLVIRLITSPHREAHDLGRISHAFHAPRIDARCRVVVVPGSIGHGEELALARAASYHVETARAKGPAIPLMHALASGRPAIVPDHSAYCDWVDESTGLLVASHPEPTAWPMDGLGKHATTWNRVAWNDLRDHLVESAAIADDDPVGYERLSAEARARLASRTNLDDLAKALRDALARLPARSPGAYAWA